MDREIGQKCALDFRIHVEDRRRQNSRKAHDRIVERKITKYYSMSVKVCIDGSKVGYLQDNDRI